MDRYDVLIIGGGLAGLTAALHLCGSGLRVLVLEKNNFPIHKVCGEYLSNEVKAYLEFLGVCLPEAKKINELHVGTESGRRLTSALPLGGMGISRYVLDAKLYHALLNKGGEVCNETVNEVVQEAEGFRLITSSREEYTCKVLIAAYGKRDGLDRNLRPRLMQKSSPWLAVKAHYQYTNWPEHQVGLYPFRGGYAGLSKTETGHVNLCYLASYDSFKPFKSIETYNTEVLSRNPFLKEFLSKARMVFEKPLTIGQIAFGKKTITTDNILYCGDTAGLIHPLCGNGMAMAIHSGKLAASLILEHWGRAGFSSNELSIAYRNAWNATFSKRIRLGRQVQWLMLQPRLSGLATAFLAQSPRLLKTVIQRTHGKPITP